MFTRSFMLRVLHLYINTSTLTEKLEARTGDITAKTTGQNVFNVFGVCQSSAM